MAFIADDPNANPTVEDKNKLGAPGGAPGIGGTGGAGGLFGSGPPGEAGGGTPTQAPKANASGSWTNLQSYLAANQDQAGKMATDVTGAVSQEAQGAQAGLASDVGAFNSAVDQGTVKADDDVFNEAALDPTSVANDEAKAAKFTSALNGTYGGPTQFNPSESTMQAYTTAAGDVANAGSAGGQQALLNKQYGGEHQYNQGEKNLDQLLIGGSSEGQKAFKDLAGSYKDIGGEVGQAAQSAIPTIQAAQTKSGQSVKAAHGVLYGNGADSPGAIKAAQDHIAKEVTDAQTARQTAYDTLAAAVKSNQFTPEQLQQLGLQSGTQTYGVDLNKYLSNDVGTVDRGQVATPEDIATMNALAKLSGDNTLSSYVSGGTQPLATPATFNAGKLTSDIGTARAEYNNAMSQSFPGATSEMPNLKQALAYINQMGPAAYTYMDRNFVNSVIAAANNVGAKYGQGGYSFGPNGLSSPSTAQTVGTGAWSQTLGAVK